jgi:hypothetical protein
MKAIKLIYTSILLIAINFASLSQTEYLFLDSIPNPFNFNEFNIQMSILHEINQYRHANSLDVLKIRQELASAANDYSRFLQKNDYATFKKKESDKKLFDKLEKYRGSKKVQYVIVQTKFSLGDYDYTYRELGNNIVSFICNKSKTKDIINNSELKYVGISFKKLKEKRKIKGIIIFGSYDAINPGALAREDYKYPNVSSLFSNIGNTEYKLRPYSKRACSKIDKFNFYNDLRDNLYLEKHKVFLEYDDKKSFFRLFRNHYDGIAVDFVIKDQFPCNNPNIIDYNLVNTGMLLRPAYTRKLKKKNVIKGRKNKNLKIPFTKEFYIHDIMGERRVHDDYELNLYIIQNRHICKIITPENSRSKIKDRREYFLDTIYSKFREHYTNKTLDNNYYFKIPFEKGKHEFKLNDVKPFLKTLNRYKGNIKSIQIEAFSSIEGNVEFNKELQSKRARSIIETIEESQNKVDISNIHTTSNWDGFYTDIQNSEFEYLLTKPKDSILFFVNKNAQDVNLENILSKHRFAQVNMVAEFNFRNKREELGFFKDRLKIHLINKDFNEAKYYHKLIIKNILSSKFEEDCLKDIKIPFEPGFSKLLMNNLWLNKYLLSDNIPQLSINEISPLFQLDSSNYYIRLNYLLAYISEFQSIEDYNENYINQNISILSGNIPKEFLNTIKLESKLKKIDLLLKDIDVNDTEEISQVLNLISLNEKNSTPFAKIFIQRGQYKLAEKILDPYMTETNTDHNFWLTYLSIFNPNNNNFRNFKFVNALRTYKNLFPYYFCDLINEGFYSIQIFENPEVKKLFCNSCQFQ